MASKHEYIEGVGPEDGSVVAKEDAERLQELGWWKSAEGGWTRFV